MADKGRPLLATSIPGYHYLQLWSQDEFFLLLTEAPQELGEALDFMAPPEARVLLGQRPVWVEIMCNGAD